MKRLTLIAALAALAGCAQQPQLSDVERCQMDGYEIGTPMMLECTGQRQAVRMQAAAMFFGMAQAQTSYNPVADVARASMYNRPITCTGVVAFVCQ